MNEKLNSPSNSTTAIAVFDIDGVIRDVGGSYRRAITDTVEHFTAKAFRPSPTDIDNLKSEGIWNNDWEASQELVYRYFEAQGKTRTEIALDYQQLIDFFQSRYQGPDPAHWTGYICNEPLLLSASYLESLTQAGIGWGFFSGAPRAEAAYILQGRLGIESPVLVAMEDAPGKPDPTGLFASVRQLETSPPTPLLQGEGSKNSPPFPRREGGSGGLGQLETSPPTPLLQGEGSLATPPFPDREGGSGGLGQTPVIYVGDTVADMLTVQKARLLQPSRRWVAVGILPPHLINFGERRDIYTDKLRQAGAEVILSNVQELTVNKIWEIL